MQIVQHDPIDSDVLQELGLIHDSPLHTDVINNETGFALYIETPHRPDNDQPWVPLFGLEQEQASGVHVDDYVPDMAPEYYTEDSWWDVYLRIREVDDEDGPGGWHTIKLDEFSFLQNTNPPDALDVDEFDSVTWLEGLESGKDYQLQLWFDLDENGQLNPQGRFIRETYTLFEDGEEKEYLDDYYRWQEADLYSDIHSLNTDPDAFNVDVDSDGAMDFFIA